MNSFDPSGLEVVHFFGWPTPILDTFTITTVVFGNRVQTTFGFGYFFGPFSFPFWYPLKWVNLGPIPPPPALGQPDGTRGVLLGKSEAPPALQSALDRLSGDCIRQIADRTSLKNKAVALRYWDARKDREGLLTANNIIGGLPKQAIMDIQFGANAYTLLHPGGNVSNNVVLKANFWLKDRKEQDAILIHELLHYHFNQNTDDGLAQWLRIYLKGQESSPRITSWLLGNCNSAFKTSALGDAPRYLR